MPLIFRSPTTQPLHIGLTTGHTAVVTPEGNELHPMFQREAIARGALAGDDVAPILGAAPAFDRAAVITAAMNAMLDGSDKEDFNADGKPNLRRLAARVGFQVDREEVDAIFEEITKPKGDGAPE